MKYLLSLLLVLAACFVCVQPARSYPAGGRIPDISEESYLHESGDVAPNSGDLLFYGPDDKPPFDSLTDTELLMLGGSRPKDGLDYLPPYWMLVPTRAGSYYREFGKLPEVLDAEAIRSIPRFRNATDAEVDLCRNPLTGKWPRLNAKKQSPGDFYLRVLTPEEERRYAKSAPDAVAFRGGAAQLDSLYFIYGRMYGEKAPLVSFFSPFSEGAPGAMP